MDDYPRHYVEHNLPLVVLFGLRRRGQDEFQNAEKAYPLLEEKGIYISSEFPNVPADTADELLGGFREFDARQASWNGRPGSGKMGTMGFTYRAVGRAFTLPPRKALLPPELEVSSDRDGARRPSASPFLHSPISPLTPDSNLFPDGIMTSSWFSKHQCLLPSALISFYAFTVDENSSTLQDNKLKTEINGLRTSINSSTYKFRLIVVLISDGERKTANTAERVGNVRRGTSLDARSLFLLPKGLASVELRAFVGTILASLQPTCIEYYRDLSKHARRKKNRGAIPPPTAPPTSGTSQTLSTQGWNVRYEIKLGAFAEFRQEMDAAGHSYEAAYENLVDSDVLESVPSWSPRFDEARLLADILAIRIMRCLLWTGQTTSAVQSWNNHRSRMQELVDRRGKGSSTYGWQAWEARWSAVMARLIERIDLPIFHVPDAFKAGDEDAEAPDIYAIPENAFSNETRLPPWDLLHHEGYWLWRSVRHTRARRRLALGIPKEDRNSPGNSPASAIASRTHLYDTFLCPEPHKEYGLPGKESFNHSALLIKTLEKATHHFAIRQQSRFAERTMYETARELTKSDKWAEAMEIIKPLWKNLSWRRAGWWHLLEEVSWTVRACARNLGDGEALIAVEWELLSNKLSPRANWTYDFSKCLDSAEIEEIPHAFIDSEALAPCLTATFAFGSPSGSVGIALSAQLTLSLQTHHESAPATFPEVVIFFEGSLQQIRIFHDATVEPSALYPKGRAEFFDIALGTDTGEIYSPKEASPQRRELHGSGNLTFSPNATKILSFESVPREPGEVRASRLALAVSEGLFTAEVSVPIREVGRPLDWWRRQESELLKGKLNFERHCSLEIRPKPPKLKVDLPDLRTAYYTDEVFEIRVTLLNEEEDEVDVTLSAQLTGSGERSPQLHWILNILTETDGGSSPSFSKQRDAEYAVGKLQPAEVRECAIRVQALSQMAEYALEVRADYTLQSDPDTPVTKTVRETLVFIGPFEANCDFIPRENQDSWPSFFSVSQANLDTSRPGGLTQKWRLALKIASFSMESLVVERTNLVILDSKPGAVCTLHQPEGDGSRQCTLQPNELADRTFDLDVQKTSIEDNQTSVISFQLNIFWHRESDRSPPPSSPGGRSASPSSRSADHAVISKGFTTETSLLIPSLSVPFGEPRVLASARPSPSHATTFVHLTYTIENPSMHVLTFSATMEASDEFAFSGPKSVTVTLVPLDRTQLRYNLLPAQQGVWIRPVFKVLDVGFGKVLRVFAAEGCRTDKKGLMVWAEAE